MQLPKNLDAKSQLEVSFILWQHSLKIVKQEMR